jgi:hypothetical protein
MKNNLGSVRPATAVGSARQPSSGRMHHQRPASTGLRTGREVDEHDEPMHPAMREFREMEAAMKSHNNAMLKQAKIVESALFAAEVVTSASTAALFSSELASRDANGALRQEYSETVKFGPRLRGVLQQERIEDCRRILLNNEDRESEESLQNAVAGLFSSPIEALELLSRHNERMVCDTYALLVDLCSELQPKKSFVLQPHAMSLRRLLATLMLNVSTAQGYCWELRTEVERLESLLESTTKRKDDSCRAAQELLHEVQSLRSQIFKSIADTEVPDALNPKIAGTESDRALVMLQIENTHQLRLRRPKLVSEALLQARIIIEGALIEHDGRRTNFNSATESKEPFDIVKNRMFPPESFMMDFASVTDAMECCASIHSGLLHNVEWSSQLLAMPEFAEVRNGPGEKAPIVWGGLRIRAAIHVGTLRSSTPFANSTLSDNCLFLSGMAGDRLMQLLRIARGGDTVLSEQAAALFQKFRFEDPRCCPSLQLKPLVAGGAKLSRVTVESLLLRESPQYEPRSVDQCTFPAVSFWRSQEGEDLSKLQFGSEAEVETRTRFTSKEYEARIEALVSSEQALKDKVVALEAEVSCCQSELQANRDVTQQAQVDSVRAAAAQTKLARRVQNLSRRLALLEESNMTTQDMIPRLMEHVAASEKDLVIFRRADAAMKRRCFVEGESQTEELAPPPPPPPPPPSVEKPPEPCADCSSLRLGIQAAHSTLRTLSGLVDEVCLGSWDAAELFPIFAKRTRSAVKDLLKKSLREVTSRTSTDDIVDSLLGNAVGVAHKLVELTLQHSAASETNKQDAARLLEKRDDALTRELEALRSTVAQDKADAATEKQRFTSLSECYLELIRLLSNFRREMEEVSRMDEMLAGLAPMLPYYAAIGSELETDGKRIEQEPNFRDVSALLLARSRRRMIVRESRADDFDECAMAMKQTLGNVRRALSQHGETSPRLMSMRMSPTRSNLSPRLGQIVMSSASTVKQQEESPPPQPTRGVVFVEPDETDSKDFSGIRRVLSMAAQPSQMHVTTRAEPDVDALREVIEEEFAQKLLEATSACEAAEEARQLLERQVEDLMKRPPRPMTSEAETSTPPPPLCSTEDTQTVTTSVTTADAQTTPRETKPASTQTKKDIPPDIKKESVATMTDSPPEIVVVPSATHQNLQRISPRAAARGAPPSPRPTGLMPALDRVADPADTVPRGSAARYARETTSERPASSSGRIHQTRLVAGSGPPVGSGASQLTEVVPYGYNATADLGDARAHSQAQQPVGYRYPPTNNVEITSFGVREIIDDGAIYLPLSNAPSPAPQQSSRPPTASRQDFAGPERVSSAHNKAVPRSSKFVVVKRANMSVGLGFE